MILSVDLGAESEDSWEGEREGLALKVETTIIYLVPLWGASTTLRDVYPTAQHGSHYRYVPIAYFVKWHQPGYCGMTAPQA